MDIQDKILSTVLDIDERLKRVEIEVQEGKSLHDRTYNRIDGFLTLIDRHEAEIAALRSQYERLEERVIKLETQQA